MTTLHQASKDAINQELHAVSETIQLKESLNFNHAIKFDGLFCPPPPRKSCQCACLARKEEGNMFLLRRKTYLVADMSRQRFEGVAIIVKVFIVPHNGRQVSLNEN